MCISTRFSREHSFGLISRDNLRSLLYFSDEVPRWETRRATVHRMSGIFVISTNAFHSPTTVFRPPSFSCFGASFSSSSLSLFLSLSLKAGIRRRAQNRAEFLSVKRNELENGGTNRDPFGKTSFRVDHHHPSEIGNLLRFVIGYGIPQINRIFFARLRIERRIVNPTEFVVTFLSWGFERSDRKSKE